MIFGTHGYPDGSVIYWQSPKNKENKSTLIDKSKGLAEKILVEIQKH
jgi:hypothetical protein